MRKKDKAKLEALAEKIASGECTRDNLFQFVDFDTWYGNKTFINNLFKYKKIKDTHDMLVRTGRSSG